MAGFETHNYDPIDSDLSLDLKQNLTGHDYKKADQWKWVLAALIGFIMGEAQEGGQGGSPKGSESVALFTHASTLYPTPIPSFSSPPLLGRPSFNYTIFFAVT